MNDPEDPRVPVPAPSECRREKCAARRTAILDAALEEFSRQGFAAARMEDIARRARVSKGSLYLYFPTKKALFQGVIEEGFRPFFEHKQALLRDTSLSPRDKLLRMYAPLITGGPDSSLRRCVRLAFSEGLHDPELMGGFYESFLAPNTARLREEFLPAARAQCARRPGPLSPAVDGALAFRGAPRRSFCQRRAPGFAGPVQRASGYSFSRCPRLIPFGPARPSLKAAQKARRPARTVHQNSG